MKNESYSVGKMYDIEIEQFEETDEDYAYDVISFLWKYVNSYDDEIGICKVVISNYYAENLTRFECRIDDIDKASTLILKGYRTQ